MKPTWGLVATHWIFAAVCMLGFAGAYHLYATNLPPGDSRVIFVPEDFGKYARGLSDKTLAAELVDAQEAWRAFCANVTNIDAGYVSDDKAVNLYGRYKALRKETDARAKRP